MSTTITPFLRLAKPPFESVPWDEAINGNMDIIDAFIAQYMSVPNYAGVWTNSTYYVVGQNVLDVANSTIYQNLITHTSPAAPTTFAEARAAHPEWWQQVYAVVSAAPSITASDAPPISSQPNDLWFDTVSTQLYIRYNDGDSQQWVSANNTGVSVPEAPQDGGLYARQNGQWVRIP